MRSLCDSIISTFPKNRWLTSPPLILLLFAVSRRVLKDEFNTENEPDEINPDPSGSDSTADIYDDDTIPPAPKLQGNHTPVTPGRTLAPDKSPSPPKSPTPPLSTMLGDNGVNGGDGTGDSSKRHGATTTTNRIGFWTEGERERASC